MQEQQVPVAPVEPKSEAPKNNNKALVIILCSLIVAIIVAAIVAVVIIINVNKEVKGNPVSKTENEISREAEEGKEKPKKDSEEPEEEKEVPSFESIAISQRDTRREDDMARVLTAVNNYQANNNGKIPFSDGEVNKNFIKRYIDLKVETTDGMNVTKCGEEFKDPNGKCYNFAKPVVLKSNKKDALKGITTVNNKFYVFIQARCGDNGEVEYRTDTRDVAIMYKLEKDDKVIACNDNY